MKLDVRPCFRWQRHRAKLLLLSSGLLLLFVLFKKQISLGGLIEFSSRLIGLAIIGLLLFILGILLDRGTSLRTNSDNLWKRFNYWLYSSQHTRRNAWVAASGLTFFVFTLFLIFFYKRYDYIDDPPIRDSVMANVALLFSANLLRESLHFLYQNIPSLPWYGISLYISMVGTFIIIFYLVLTHPTPWISRIIYSLLLISMYIPFWVRASYNYASSLPGGIALIAFYDLWRGKSKLSIWRSFLWGLLLLVSFIFRRDGPKIDFAFIAPPILAFLAFQVLKSKPNIRQVLFYTTCLIAFLLPFGAIQVFDEYQYKTVLTWQEQYHRTANRSRSAYYGQSRLLPAILGNQALLDENGWDQNDVMVAEYGMVQFDENKFALERFNNIFNSEKGLTQSESREGISGVIYNINHFGQDNGFIWFTPGWFEFNESWDYRPYYLAIITLVCFILWRGKHYYDRLFALGFLGYTYFINIYMLNYLRLPRHVAVPPLVLFYVAVFICPSIDYTNITLGWYRKVLLTLVGLGFIVSFIGFVRLNYTTDQEIPIKRQQFVDLYQDMEERFGSDAFVYIRPPLYTNYFVDPLGDQGPSNQLSYMNVSSTAYSPIYYQFLKSKGLDYGYQLLPWMVDNPKAYLAGNKPILNEWIRTFIYETYGIEVEMEHVYTYPDGLVIYRLVSTNKFTSSYIASDDLIDEFNQAEVIAPNSKYVQKGFVTIDNRSREVLFQYPGSQIFYDMLIPPSGYINFGIGISPEYWETPHPIGDGVTFRIYIENKEQRELVFEEYINPKTKPEERHWFDYNLRLDQWTGQQVKLILETDPGKDNNSLNDWAIWAEPQVGEWSYYNFIQKFYLGYPVPQRLEQLRVERLLINNSYRDAILEVPDQELHFTVNIEDNSYLNFQIGLGPTTNQVKNPGGVQFRVLVSEGSGGYEEVFKKYMDLENSGVNYRWLEESVDLSRYSGKLVELVFATVNRPNREMSTVQAYWISPRLVKNKTTIP